MDYKNIVDMYISLIAVWQLPYTLISVKLIVRQLDPVDNILSFL